MKCDPFLHFLILQLLFFSVSRLQQKIRVLQTFNSANPHTTDLAPVYGCLFDQAFARATAATTVPAIEKCLTEDRISVLLCIKLTIRLIDLYISEDHVDSNMFNKVATLLSKLVRGKFFFPLRKFIVS